MEEITILRGNLTSALIMAINKRREHEREELNYTRDSGLVAGWQEVLDGLNEGKTIKIK